MSDFMDMLVDLGSFGWLGLRKRGGVIEEASSKTVAEWMVFGTFPRRKYEAAYFCGRLIGHTYNRLDRVTTYGGRMWLMAAGNLTVECTVTPHGTLKATGKTTKEQDYFGEVTAHSGRELIDMLDDKGMRTHREYLCGVVPIEGARS